MSLKTYKNGPNAVFDEHAFVEYCIRRAESLSADEQAISIRTKIPRNRLQTILADLQQQNKIIPVSSGVFIQRDTASDINKSILDLIADLTTNNRPKAPE